MSCRCLINTKQLANRGLFFWIGLVFVLASLFSENYIVSHAAHDCRGEDCPVCLLIQRAENFSRQAKNAVFYPGPSVNARRLSAVIFGLVIFRFVPLSAVRLKVKMNR
jgi:hypothetical protein